MANLKGIGFYTLSKSTAKKFEISDDLKNQISKEELINKTNEAYAHYIDYEGVEHKYTESGYVFIMTKKFEKVKKVIAVVVVKRIPMPKPETKKKLEIFEEARDFLEVSEYYYLPEYNEQNEAFASNVVSHLKDQVAFGSIKEAHFNSYVVKRKEKNSILGHTVSYAALFMLFWIVWGTIFKNFGIGLIYAMLFSSSFMLTTSGSTSEVVNKENNEVVEEE